MHSAVDIVSVQVMPNTARTIQRWDISICRHNDGITWTDSSPYAAIVSNVALKRCILLASLILEMKIGMSLPIANHAQLFFPESHFGSFYLRCQDGEIHCII